jgi:hypothetical protein
MKIITKYMKIQFNQPVSGTYQLVEDFFTSKPLFNFEANTIYEIKKVELFSQNKSIKSKLEISSRLMSDEINYNELNSYYKGFLKVKYCINGKLRTITIELLDYSALDFKLFK